MIGHYVEDDALDAFSLIGLINGEGNLALTTSTSLKDFADWVTPNDVDFVLLDIYRPDAISLKKDVAKIRESSAAPIIFITGDEARHYREEAVLAGAQAVVEKAGLSLASLQDVLRSIVTEQPREEDPEQNEHSLVLVEQGLPSTIDPERVEIMFAYVRDIHGALAASEADDEALKSTLTLLSGASSSLRAYYSKTNALGQSENLRPPLPMVVRSIQEAALASADVRKVHFIFQMGTNAIEGLSDFERIQFGIRHFIYSAIIGSPANNTVSFTGAPTERGLRLNISSNEPFNFSEDDIFQRKLPSDLKSFNSTIAMTLAMMLLGVEQTDFTMFSRGSLHTLMIDHSENCLDAQPV